MPHLVLWVPLESATVDPSILPSAWSGPTPSCSTGLLLMSASFSPAATLVSFLPVQLLSENRETKDGVRVSFHVITTREGGFSYNGGLENGL